MMNEHDHATLQVGDTEVAIRRRNRSGVRVATILGREVRDGYEYIYLDSLVHHVGEDTLGEWRASGAVSTILSRDVRPSESQSSSQ